MRGLLTMAATVAGCGRIAFEASSNADARLDTAAVDGVSWSICTSPRLIAHWPLDETSGNLIGDRTGTYDGQWNDSDNNVATEATTGMRGGALTFGTNRWVTVGNFTIPAEGTFAVWLRSAFDETTQPAQHPMVIDAPSPRTTISYDSTLDVYGVRTNDVSYQVSHPINADITAWFHFAATWSATGAGLYLDGGLVATSTGIDARSTSPPGLYLGTREALDRWWDGVIDDVRFYDYALSAEEVAELLACP